MGYLLLALQDVLKRDPNIVDAHVALAVSYWSSNDYSRAEDEWRVACQSTELGCREYKDLAWVKEQGEKTFVGTC